MGAGATSSAGADVAIGAIICPIPFSATCSNQHKYKGEVEKVFVELVSCLWRTMKLKLNLYSFLNSELKIGSGAFKCFLKFLSCFMPNSRILRQFSVRAYKIGGKASPLG